MPLTPVEGGEDLLLPAVTAGEAGGAVLVILVRRLYNGKMAKAYSSRQVA